MEQPKDSEYIPECSNTPLQGKGENDSVGQISCSSEGLNNACLPRSHFTLRQPRKSCILVCRAFFMRENQGSFTKVLLERKGHDPGTSAKSK